MPINLGARPTQAAYDRTKDRLEAIQLEMYIANSARMQELLIDHTGLCQFLSSRIYDATMVQLFTFMEGDPKLEMWADVRKAYTHIKAQILRKNQHSPAFIDQARKIRLYESWTGLVIFDQDRYHVILKDEQDALLKSR